MELDLLPKQRKPIATSPIQVAVQIRKKQYHQIQQRHSPCPTTVRLPLLSRVGSVSGVQQREASQSSRGQTKLHVESICSQLRDECSMLRVKKNAEQ